MPAAPLVVHAWADVVCPWSYLSRGRFAEGVRLYHQQGGDRPVLVEYHSLQLAPDTPEDFDGSELDFLVQHRSMTVEHASAMLSEMSRVAAAEGVVVDYDRVRHSNSRRAHELVHEAKAQGRQDEMVERLMRAHFVEGRHLGHIDELVDLAAEVGLHPLQTRTALESGMHAAAVADDIERSVFFRIRALPFLLIGPRFGVSGAHEPAYYAEVIAKSAAAAD